jgi:hypothetical protein
MLGRLRRKAVWAFGTNPASGRAEWWLASRHVTGRAAARRAAYLNRMASEGYLYVPGPVDRTPRG